MADSGGTEGTPVQPGAPTGFNVSEPLKYTWLSRDYFAKIQGINPVLFRGATAESIGVFPLAHNRNNDLWPRYSWQDADRISHEDLARAIYDAEQDIARVVKYPLMPDWIAQDVKMYPRHHRPDVWQVGGLDVRGARKSVILDNGKLITPGQRSTTLIGTATVGGGSLAYADEDGDGFAETATITMATTLTNACEIKVYMPSTGGVQEWEIREPRSKSISGGIFTAVFFSWLFINPDLQSVFPSTSDFSAIDIGTVANYVSSVDVYREFTNTTSASVTFFWEPHPPWLFGVCGICGTAGCTACVLTTQDGCFHIRNAHLGEAVPTPATFDATTGNWNATQFSVCRDPDQVRLYYQAGDLSNENLAGRTCQPLSNWWAQTIAWIATARLERPFCAGTNVLSLTKKFQKDMALTGAESFQISEGDLDNPFGTRVGEVMAWRRVKKIATKRTTGVAI